MLFLIVLVFLLNLSFSLEADHHRLIILGAGPAGLTAGIYAGRSQLKPLIISSREQASMLRHAGLENWPGLEHVEGEKLLADMQAHAEGSGCLIKMGHVTKINVLTRPFSITLSDKTTYTCDALIVAAGLRPLSLSCFDELNWDGGIGACAICDGPRYKDKPVIVIGSGFLALKNALFLRKYTNNVIVLNEKDKFDALGELVHQVQITDGISVYTNHTVTGLYYADDASVCKGVSVFNGVVGEQSIFRADGIFVSVGFEGHRNLFEGQLPLDNEGKIICDSVGRTAVDGVFVAGMASNFPYWQAIVCAGAGCVAALEAEKYLSKIPA